jgi:hypothetical protein
MKYLTVDKIKKISLFLLISLVILVLTGITAYAGTTEVTNKTGGVRFAGGEGMLGLQN